MGAALNPPSCVCTRNLGVRAKLLHKTVRAPVVTTESKPKRPDPATPQAAFPLFSFTYASQPAARPLRRREERAGTRVLSLFVCILCPGISREGLFTYFCHAARASSDVALSFSLRISCVRVIKSRQDSLSPLSLTRRFKRIGTAFELDAEREDSLADAAYIMISY